MGLKSTPPSPYLVKNPIPSSSTLFHVHTTIEFFLFAVEYSCDILNLDRRLTHAKYSLASSSPGYCNSCIASNTVLKSII